jgi:hypothetical protein
MYTIFLLASDQKASKEGEKKIIGRPMVDTKELASPPTIFFFRRRRRRKRFLDE